MRVIQTIASTLADFGGTSRVVPSICDALALRGMDCHLITGLAGRPESSSVLPKLARVHVPAESASDSGHFVHSLGQLAGEGDVVVHDHAIWLANNHEVARYCRKRHLKRVVSPHGMLSPWALANGRWKKNVAWTLYQRRDLLSADVIHATSELEVDEIRRLGLGRPVALIPNGFDFPTEMPPRMRSETRTALFLSRIHPKKGLLNLVQAWRESASDEWRLAIVGPDENGHAAEVRHEIERLGLQTRVSIHQPLDDNAKWQAYVNADLFVLPSFSENFGIVIAEAMVAGLPVLTTTQTPWQVLNELQIGWCVPPTKESLALALRDALGLDESSLREKGRAAREYVMSKYSWKGMAAGLSEVYEWLSGQGSRPASVTQ